jgi:hypothetical protein
LENFCGWLKKEPNELFEVLPNVPTVDAKALPSLAVVIGFDPQKYTAKTVTVSSQKRVAKEWIKDHS